MHLFVIAFVLAGTIGVCLANEPGIRLPDTAGAFTFTEDFATAKFVGEAFVENLTEANWSPGSITTEGPNRHRILTYRFWGERVIDGIQARVDQTALPNLGGLNRLWVSPNGLDWTLAASSADQKPGGNTLQTEPLTVPPEIAARFAGKVSELWARIELDNYSGLPTATSNIVRGMAVTLTLGEVASEAADLERERLLRLRQALVSSGGSTRTLSPFLATGLRDIPRYYEAPDGWLYSPDENRALAPDETTGFRIQRALGFPAPLAQAMVVYVRAEVGVSRMLAKITVRKTREGSRRMQVLWDGRPLGEFDTGDYFGEDEELLLEIPGPVAAGPHELRITAGDRGPVSIRELRLHADGPIAWAQKPALPRGGALEVLSAAYAADPPPPANSQVVEGRHARQEAGLVFAGLQRFHAEHGDFGALRLIVRNTGTAPLRISDRLLLNDIPIEKLYVDFERSRWDAPGVVWYRVRPRLLEAGECGEVTIRLRRRLPGKHASVTLFPEGGQPIRTRIPYAETGIAIDYVTTDASGEVLYAYARRRGSTDPGRVLGLSLDGKPLPQARIYGGDFPGGVCLAVARLPRALALGSRHVVGMRTSTGEGVGAQFRVQPFIFPRSSIHVPPARTEEMGMNLAMWFAPPLEVCQEYDLWATTQREDVFELHERVLYVMGPDEPDAGDNRGGGYDVGLGYHARGLAEGGWQELIDRLERPLFSWIIMNGTTRPLNWCVYGQLADIACFDPYPINFYGADHAYVRESLGYARLCGAPSRLYACLETFGWGAGQGVPTGARGPTPQEYRQNVVQAIGAGMKGLTSWVYNAGAGGWALSEPCAQEMARMNRLIAQIEGELLLGTPVDLVTSDAGTVMTGVVGDERWPKDRVAVAALLCGPDALVITAANHVPASKPDPPTIEPARGVTITVTLPQSLVRVEAFEVTETGLVPFPCEVADGRAVLRVDEIETGRVWVLR